MNGTSPSAPSSFLTSAYSKPSHSHTNGFDLQPLTDADHAVIQRRLEEVQATLSSLPPSQLVPHLLAHLQTAYQQQLASEHQAAQRTQQRDKIQQRLARLRAEIDELRDELEDGTDAQPPHANGKEEKYNGHHTQLQPRARHSQASSTSLSPAPADGAVEPSFHSMFSDYSTLLAVTEARLEVERRQRQSQQPPPQPSLSAPSTASIHYQHDHTLTGAGKQLVRSILSLASTAGSLDLAQLQRLCERTGRTAAVAGADDEGDVWWLWQSYASEGEDGEQGIGQAELEQLYEREWDIDEDAQRLGLA